MVRNKDEKLRLFEKSMMQQLLKVISITEYLSLNMPPL